MSFNDNPNEFLSEPRKVTVWAEDSKVETKEYYLPKKTDEMDDDIPTIPDFEDFQEVFEKDIAKAPTIPQSKVSMYEELDSEIMKQQTFSLGDIDLSPLLTNIRSNEPKEADDIWTVDSIINDLVADEEKNIMK